MLRIMERLASVGLEGWGDEGDSGNEQGGSDL